MVAVEPAAHISAEAQAHLADPPPVPPLIDLSDHALVAATRAEVHTEWRALNDTIADHWVMRDEIVAGVACTRFGRDDASLDADRVLVHLHGGSYVYGSPVTNAVIPVPIAQRTGLPVVSVDYRLAPEHPCPAAIDDAVAVIAELARSHRVVGVFGESAGGGLAVSVCVALRDAGHPLPERLGLIAPWVDLTCSGDTYRTNLHVDPDFPDPAEPPAYAAAYAGADLTSPQASPLFADLSGLPPTVIQVGSREVLLSDACRLDAALRRHGVASTLDVWDGLWHVWHLSHHLPESQLAFDELASFLTNGRVGEENHGPH